MSAELTVIDGRQETHAQAARRLYAEAMERARLAVEEAAARTALAQASAAEVSGLSPMIPVGVSEEYRQLAEHLDARGQSIEVLMARSGK